VTADPLACLFI